MRLLSMLRRALLAEGLGWFLLAATVIGSGIMAERLAGGNLAVALLANCGNRRDARDVDRALGTNQRCTL